jgi:hypothetical protein
MRLNGWQRLGVVASFVWLIGSGINLHRDIERHVQTETRRIQNVFEKCRDSVIDAGSVDFRHCTEGWAIQHKWIQRWDWQWVLEDMLVPLTVAWVAAALSVIAFRWVQSGFCQK